MINSFWTDFLILLISADANHVNTLEHVYTSSHVAFGNFNDLLDSFFTYFQSLEIGYVLEAVHAVFFVDLLEFELCTS